MFDFGLLLKQLRESKGYSQADLAKKINKSKSAISRYENNLKVPPIDTLIDLAILYNVSLDYLVGIEKKQSVVIENLTEEQKSIIHTILAEFNDTRSVLPNGLTKRQQDILNGLLVQFNRKV